MYYFVSSCARCTQAKVPCQKLLAGKLLPLPTPTRTWSHIAIDYLTDLPVSEGMNTILAVIDRFSWAIKLLLSFHLHSRQQRPLYPWNATTADIPGVKDWFVHSERVWEQAHQHITAATERHHVQADKGRGETPTCKPVEKVWLSMKVALSHLLLYCKPPHSPKQH